MIRYYPKNKITPDLYSDGSSLLLNGKPYYGYYYETYDGKFYTGARPENGLNNLLIPNITPAVNKVNKNNSQKQPQFILNPSLSTVEQEIAFDFTNKFIPYYPKPTTNDYTKGYFTRYFSKTVGHNDSIVEISKSQFDNFQTSADKQSTLLYQVINIFWQISGPLNNTRGYAGIIDTNKRIVNNKEVEFSGLKLYINNQYDKFSIPTNIGKPA